VCVCVCVCVLVCVGVSVFVNEAIRKTALHMTHVALFIHTLLAASTVSTRQPRDCSCALMLIVATTTKQCQDIGEDAQDIEIQRNGSNQMLVGLVVVADR
jgi:hypothetical protein